MNVDHLNIAAILDLHANARPDKPAIVSATGEISYVEIARRVRQTADHLVNLGARVGTRVGLSLHDTDQHLISLLAIARLGAIAVPMDVRWTGAEKSRLATALDVNFALVEPEDRELELGRPGHVVDAAWQEAVARQDGSAPLVIEPSLPFVFSLSSGTTSSPSGPLLCHHHFFHRFANQWVTLGFNSHDRFLAATPLYFGGTRGFCLSLLFAGGTVCLSTSPSQIAEIADSAAKFGATAAFLVPTQLRWLLSLDDDTLAPLRKLRVLVSSGSALHAEEQEELRRRICPNLFNYYGTTEGGGISILAPDDWEVGAGSVGRPVFMVEIEIVDENDRLLPRGEVGRIRYRGPGMADGDAPAAGDHAAATGPLGWFYPGDLGLLDAHGFLHLQGRSKDMIVRGGVNVYPQEIEETLLALDGVADAAVVGWPSRELGEEIAAFVVPSTDHVSGSDLREACRAHLGPYKLPRHIYLVDDLPRNSSGKVLKTRLRERLDPIE